MSPTVKQGPAAPSLFSHACPFGGEVIFSTFSHKSYELPAFSNPDQTSPRLNPFVDQTSRRRCTISGCSDYSPDYLARVRSTTNGYLSTLFADAVELSMRIS